jgi:hypothetical protein
MLFVKADMGTEVRVPYLENESPFFTRVKSNICHCKYLLYVNCQICFLKDVFSPLFLYLRNMCLLRPPIRWCLSV